LPPRRSPSHGGRTGQTVLPHHPPAQLTRPRLRVHARLHPHHGLVHHPADARRRQSESHHHRHLQPHDGRLQLAPRRRTRHRDTALHAHVHHAHQPAPVTTSRRNDAMTQLVTPTLQSPQKAPRQRAPRKRRSVPLVLGIYAFVMAFLTALPLLILIPVSLNPKPLVGMPDTGL